MHILETTLADGPGALDIPQSAPSPRHPPDRHHIPDIRSSALGLRRPLHVRDPALLYSAFPVARYSSLLRHVCLELCGYAVCGVHGVGELDAQVYLTWLGLLGGDGGGVYVVCGSVVGLEVGGGQQRDEERYGVEECEKVVDVRSIVKTDCDCVAALLKLRECFVIMVVSIGLFLERKTRK